MITRTTIGADFEGALTYGARVRQGDTPKKQAELIGSSNLGDVSNPRGLAAEMQGVADERNKCKNPVWHTSLSWAKGEHLSTAQKLQAATLYCELLRSQLRERMPAEERAAYNVWEQHQVAVYEHHDKDHEHIHIYLNRVPLDGGAAIETGRNYKFNLKAIKIITQELGLNPLPSQRQSFQDSRPPVQDTRQVVRAALVEAMADPQVQSIEQLREHLTAQGIEMRTKRSQAGQLVGVSFKQGQAAVTGQEVGMKAAQLREHYEPHQVQAQAQAQVQEPAAQLAPAEVASSQAPPVAPAEVPGQLVGQGQRPVAADVARAQPAFQVAEVPQAMLARFGWSVAKLAENGQLQKLLDGAGTDLVAMQFSEGAGAPVAFEGKFVLTRNENGAVELKMAFPKKQAQAPQLVSVVPQPQPAAAEQRPVATPPPAPERKPEPRKKKGRRI